MHGRVRCRTYVIVGFDASAAMPDTCGVEVEGVDIGDAAGAIHHPVGCDLVLDAVMRERHPKATAMGGDSFHRHVGFCHDADALAFSAKPGYCIGIDPW